MVQTRNVAKRQKTEECTSCIESVMFNSDSLFKIASYLPADGILSLALTSRRFGIGGDDSLSLVEESTRRIVHDIATEEQENALPGYDEDNWLSKYNYLQLLRAPLTFDQLAERIEYVDGNQSRVEGYRCGWATAFSNNVMMAGKHFASFEVSNGNGVYLGVMRPGEAMQSATGGPLLPRFYRNFTQRTESLQYNNSVNCCMYSTYTGNCCSHEWVEGDFASQPWDGLEIISSPCTIGLLLDSDEGTLSIYKNDRRLGVMKRGLAGHYCWVVSFSGGDVTIKRGAVPES